MLQDEIGRWPTRRGVIAGGIGALAVTGRARAEAAFPDRPINLIISFPPGGGADVFGRIMAKGLETVVGQPVIPINKPGGGSLIGTNFVKNARPDGYTLLFATASMIINPIIRHVDYDPVADFDSIGMIARATYVLVSTPKRGFKTMADLIAYAKQHPNELKFGSPGIGVSGQLAGDLLRSMADIKFIDVRYKGTVEGVLATMSGEVDFSFDSPVALLSNVKAGRLTLLGAAGEHRDPLCPDTPTIAETLPGYSIWPWFGFVAPRGVPASVLGVLRDAVQKMGEEPTMTKRLRDVDMEPFSLSAEQLTAFMISDRARWTKIASREAG